MVREGYKQTELGVIPEDWDITSIDQVGTVIRGASPRPKGDKRYYGGNIPRLMVEDVTRDGKFVKPSVDFLTEEGARRSRPCPRGTLTLVCSGTVGVPSFLEIDACIHDGFLALINIKQKVNSDFLYHFLKTQQSKFDNSATHGGVFTNLTTEIFRNFKIPLPSDKREQRSIAQALSDVDALISALDKLIAKKHHLKIGTMQQLLTGSKRLPGFGERKGYQQTEVGTIPEDWNVRALGNLGKFKNGINKGSEDFGHGSPFVNLMDVFGISSISEVKHLGLVNSNDAEKKVYDLKKGDVLFIRSSVKPSGVGLTTIVTRDLPNAVYSGFLIRFRDDGNLETAFKKYCFSEENFRKRVIASSTVSANTNINQDNLKQLCLAYPESLAEQRAIATFLSDMDAEIAALETRLAKTQSIKQGMMQELLTGRTRLV